MNKQPEVTARTKKRMTDAFWELALETDVRSVTVSAITKKAGINRSTFYAHFLDVYDLLDQVEDGLLSQLKLRLQEKLDGPGFRDFESFTRASAEIFSELGEPIFFLLGEKGDPAFRPKTQKVMQAAVFKLAGIPEDLPDRDYVGAYGISAVLGLLSHWHETGKEKSPEELLPIVQTLLGYGLFGFAGRDPFA